MKKCVIALSVAAALGGVAGTASAQTSQLSFNNDGVGHIVIVPYFSTQGGNATLLNIVNTDTVKGKAVKVRFRGASNSDDIFDFQLFLSPGDVWAANISRGASGLSRMQTQESGSSPGSCTLPSDINQDFITARLNPALTGDALANETREGYIEILNMGDIPSTTGTTSIWFATKHNSSGVAPCTASILESLSISDTRLDNPTTGLMANWTIINVPQTTTWSGEGAALEARTSGGATGPARNVFWPQTATAVGAPTIDSFSADPLFRKASASPGPRILNAANFDLPDLSTPYTLVLPPVPLGSTQPQVQANSLSAALASISMAAEYLSDPTISASTDWVIAKPTRRYYVAVDYAATTAPARLVTNYDDNSDPAAVYYRSALTDKINSNAGNVVMGTGASGNGGQTYQACTQVSGAKFFNRQEQSPLATGIVISPGQPAPLPSLCGEISVLGINSPTSPLASNVARFNITLPSGFVDGWGLLSASNLYQGFDLGLPMLLTQYVKAVNPGVSAGVSGTFGGKWIGRVTQRGQRFTP